MWLGTLGNSALAINTVIGAKLVPDRKQIYTERDAEASAADWAKNNLAKQESGHVKVFTKVRLVFLLLLALMKYLTTLDEIKQPVAGHLAGFEELFSNSLKSPIPLLNLVLRYLYRQKGKQVRPLFVYLSAGMCGEIGDRPKRAATLIELLHTATLVHDDVVDDSYRRRGAFSINALWKNKVAVLLGDYLLAKGLLLSLDHDDFDLLKIVSQATREMSEGELMQMEKARKLDISEEVYFEIIRKKTASLIASCCMAGAASAGAPADTQEKMRLFGEYVGIAFQIKDDLFDFDKSNLSGKPSGIDLKEQKMTLPIIYLLKNSTYVEKRSIIHTIKRHHSDPVSVKKIIEQVIASGGIDYARKCMISYRQKAISLLSGFPESEYRTSLESLVMFATERSK